MKTTFYVLLAAGGLLLCAPGPATARNHRLSLTDKPAEIQRKAAARERVAVAKNAAKLKRGAAHTTRKKAGGLNHAMLVALGLEESKSVTSPAKRSWQLRQLQKQLRAKTRQTSQARWQHMMH